MRSSDEAGGPRIEELLRGTRDGDEGAAREIVDFFEPGIRFFLGAGCEPEALDKVRRALIEAIRRGDIGGPERLPGFVLGIIRPLRRDHEDVSGSDRQVMRGLLDCLPARDREILVRAYVFRQPAGEIAAGMGLTESQVGPVKSRARASFERLTQGESRTGRVEIRRGPAPSQFRVPRQPQFPELAALMARCQRVKRIRERTAAGLHEQWAELAAAYQTSLSLAAGLMPQA